MSTKLTTTGATIPPGLTELLEEFAVTVLREHPTDLVSFAASYFTNLREENARNSSSSQKGSQRAGPAPNSEENQMESESMATDTPAPREMGENDSDDDDLPSDDYRTAMAYRRRSVFAEAYVPGGDEETDKIVHPKTDEQRRRLVEAVKKIFLFKSLDQEQLNEVLDAMFEKEVVPGEKIIEQGDDGDNFYVIDSGQYDCLQTQQSGGEPKLVFQYDGQGFFGELALMYNTPRAATVIATTPGTIWGLDRKTFKRILCESTSKKRSTYKQFLESVPMLTSLEPYELLNLADALERKYYSNGDCIIKEGDAADSFYIVENGNVEITREDTSGKKVFLNSCTRGQYFGELALLTHKPRAASVHAKGDVVCAALDVGAFERLLGPCIDLMRRNISNYEEQLVQLFGESFDISDAR
ncbi:PREDICTED: cAMP-dependent protein kinase type II-alpha regulatory subunit-like [Amphimedon queenslandica]|uniref:cAMP-dependent protein kinase type II regulatory subunit n=1 Tax=Amphimedon queenslandica TaxID=400682 RepID=A0A1X7VRN8_AMPQE|nr:PREDICTED: cAMP-dependent protein kinase type II-alpha regulatory subunit-like [Amphimedon queenslandica]|eukprot:XP_003382968.1 PREDICTED: cAMP-dependent protein kinase type II-alpha regulatory subunit-like [Amphimedon queenslandica]